MDQSDRLVDLFWCVIGHDARYDRFTNTARFDIFRATARSDEGGMTMMLVGVAIVDNH